MKHVILALSLALTSLSAPAMAAPNEQLVLQVQGGLDRYDLEYDVSEMSTQTVVQLKFTLAKSQPYIKTRNELRATLRRAGYPE